MSLALSRPSVEPSSVPDDWLTGAGSAVRNRNSDLVGRDDETRQLSDFLNGTEPVDCVVLVGEPGIGKTTLWEEVLVQARSLGYVIATTRCSAAEATLSFAALGDLVSEIGQEALETLPAPQRRAIEVALRRLDPDGSPPDPLTISTGFLGALKAVAAQGPLLLAIDDVHWLDQSSADPIIFAARRLYGDNARILVSRRPGPASALEQVLLPDRVARVELTGLSLRAINRLLSERIGIVLPRRELRRLYESSNGNPLFALELGRMLAGSHRSEISADLPLPRLVEDVFGYRVRELPVPVQRAVLAVSLSAGVSQSELSTLVEPGALEDAMTSGLVLMDGPRVRPSHPLLATAARQNSTARQRRELHLGLAEATCDETLRARHLALATARPDAQVARIVAAAAEVAAQRGALQESEELCAHALRLTPPGTSERVERILTLGRSHLNAGDMQRATELLESQMDEIPPGKPRALAFIMLGEAASISEEERLIAAALVEAGDDAEVRSAVLSRRTTLLAVNHVEQLDKAAEWARESIAAAKAVGGEVEMRAATALGWVLALRGQPFDELLAYDPRSQPGVILYDASIDRPFAVRLLFRGQLAEAGAIFHEIIDKADRNGELRMAVVMTIQLCELAMRAGDAVEAARLIEDLRQWIAWEEMALVSARLRAQHAALTGVPADAHRAAAEIFAVDDLARWERLAATHHPWANVTASRCLAMTALATCYDESSAEDLRAAAEEYRAMGLRFDSARCLLTLGRAERRFKKHGAARRAFEEAAALFERGGSCGWADQARAELARVSGRRRETEGLTPSELQVASLATAGMSNKEIAAKLFLSVNTIERHLHHAYGKLGVRSRAQLAEHLTEA